MRIDPTKLEKFLKNNPTKQNVAALAAINKPSKGATSDSIAEKVKSKKDKGDVASTDLPDWLHDLVFKNSDVLYCLKTKKKSDCPHVSAFVGLAKRPSMYKGKQEHYLQVALFLMAKKHLPELYEHMFSVPNGGMRSSGVAGMMKAEGQKSGYPDIAVDFARGGYFGYRLEVKTEKGMIRDGQVEWACRLNKQNYKTEVGYGFAECWSMLKEYWSLEPTVIGN